MTKSVLEADTYTSDIPCLINTFIREYDIAKANINILLDKGVIDRDTYQKLYSMPKHDREVNIGLMIRDNPDIGSILSNGFLEYRNYLYQSNNIQDYDILMIKKDAVFVIDKTLSNTKFGNVEFVLKNTYSSYYRIYRLEMLFDGLCQPNGRLDVKGLGKYAYPLHKDYFSDMLCFIFSTAEHATMAYTINTLREIMNNYVSLNYPIEYYREFNIQSMFRAKMTIADTFYGVDLPPNSIAETDISYNYGILSQLYKLYLERFLYKR